MWEAQDGRQCRRRWRLRRGLRRVAPRPRRLLGGGGARHRMEHRRRTAPSSRARRLWPLVPRRAAEHLPQRPRPSRRRRARRPAGADLRQPDDRPGRDADLRADAGAHREARRRAGRARRRRGRPGGDLHADGAGSGDRHARLRAPRRRAFRGVRRLRGGGAGGAHRRRAAQGHRRRLLRAGAGAGGRLQAAARRGDRHVAAQAGRLPDPAAARSAVRADARPRPGLRRGRGRRGAARLRAGGGDRPALHPLHLRHDRPAQGHRARHRRPCGRAAPLHAPDLRPRPRRRVLDRLRRRLGRRALLHRLCAAARRLHLRPLRGQAGRHAGCRRLLARLRPARRQGAVHRAHRAPRHQEGGPGGQAAPPARPVEAGGALPRGRALRPGHRDLGRQAARQAGGRPLVADGNRLAHHRRLPRPRPVPAQARQRRQAGAGLGHRRAGRGGQGEAPGRDRQPRRAPAAAARRLPTLWNAEDRFREAYLAAIPASTTPPTPGWWTRRAMSG